MRAAARIGLMIDKNNESTTNPVPTYLTTIKITSHFAVGFKAETSVL